jgi:hypothetical protein
MNKAFIRLLILAACLSSSNGPVFAQSSNAPAISQWVRLDAQNKLVYKALSKGDKIIDFSYAGYMGGGVSIPTVPVVMTLEPAPGDNSDLIQKAINKVSAMPLVKGFRGAILLKPGSYNCEKTLSVNASGVVVRGSGSGENGTVINMTGNRHTCFSVNGKVSDTAIGKQVSFAVPYVPAGALVVPFSDAAEFTVGDTIRITRPVTNEWIRYMGMDTLVRDGKKQTWVIGDIEVKRVIRRIRGNSVTLDVPLADSYDATYMGPGGAKITRVKATGEINQVGFENFRIFCEPKTVSLQEGYHSAFNLRGVANAWIRNVDLFNTFNSVMVSGRQSTVDRVNIYHDATTVGAAKPADLHGNGPQILFNKIYIKGENLFFFATGPKVNGPIVLLNCLFEGNGWIQPHQRWATAVLVDNCQVPQGGIDFMNRGIMGSGHGWTIGWAVAWNSAAKTFLNQMPPGAANWVIGSTGERQFRAMPFYEKPFLPEGIFDSHSKRVTPSSLYLAQLAERLGKQALKNIGY